MPRDIVITWGDNQKLATLLAERGARFFVIGSTAARFHVPEWRDPNDLDLLFEPSPDTGQKVISAFAALGVQALFTPEQFAQPSAKGMRGFPEKQVCNVDVMTPFAGFDFAEH